MHYVCKMIALEQETEEQKTKTHTMVHNDGRERERERKSICVGFVWKNRCSMPCHAYKTNRITDCKPIDCANGYTLVWWINANNQNGNGVKKYIYENLIFNLSCFDRVTHTHTHTYIRVHTHARVPAGYIQTHTYCFISVLVHAFRSFTQTTYVCRILVHCVYTVHYTILHKR